LIGNLVTSDIVAALETLSLCMVVASVSLWLALLEALELFSDVLTP